MLTASFVNVAGSDKGIDLYDLVAGGTYSAGDITVQTLNSDGTANKIYTYMKPRRGDTWFWQDLLTSETIAEGSVVFKPGQGLWISGVDGAQLTNSGAVSTDDNAIALCNGFVATGNMTPVAIDLTSLVAGGTYSAGDITVQTLNSDGTANKIYTFMKPRRGDTWFWQDLLTSETIAEGDVTFAPGQGLWISGVDGATLTFPGPTL